MGYVTDGTVDALERTVERALAKLAEHQGRIAQLEAALVEERAKFLALGDYTAYPVGEMARHDARAELVAEGLLAG